MAWKRVSRVVKGICGACLGTGGKCPECKGTGEKDITVIEFVEVEEKP